MKVQGDKFKIVKQLYRFSAEDGSIYRKELNLVEWYGRVARYDIRGWNEDHTKMTKGITLSEEEFQALIMFGKEHLNVLQSE